MSEPSYAQILRLSLADVPIKKKCCAHAFRDADSLFAEGISPEVRAQTIAGYAAHSKCPACISHFVRALFCRRGSVTDPEKRYHLEIAMSTADECEALDALLSPQGIFGKITSRKNQSIYYFKDGEAIADFLAYIGANTAAFDFMNSRINREFRNTVNRQVNCDTANIGKVLLASKKQITVIQYMKNHGIIGTLPESLRETAELRLRYEQMSLKELGDAHSPPIGKSGVNHRLANIMDVAKSLGIEEI